MHSEERDSVKSKLLLGTACALLFLAPAQPAWSQQASGGMEEVVVTGSRISGAAPVGSSVVSVSADDLEQNPATNTTDLLKNVPQFAGIGFDQTSVIGAGGNTNLVRGNALNLRGLGPNATLVLLDGQRLPFAGATGTYVDPSSIPVIALQRVEVLPDGAAAIYGSDAIAGVVNFIMRKSYDGVLLTARNSFANGYDTQQYSALAGANWDTGNLVVSYEHDDQSTLLGSERSYIRDNLTAFGGSDYRTPQCDPGTISLNGTTYAIPAGGVTPATANQLVAGTLNKCDYYPMTSIIPSQQRDSATLYAEQELTPHIFLHAEGYYSSRSFQATAVSQGTQSMAQSLRVPNTNPFFVAPPGTSPSSEIVEYNLIPAFGRAMTQTGDETTYQLFGGARADLGSWNGKFTLGYSHDESAVVTRSPNRGNLARALASTNPATAFNPFGGANSQTVIDGIKDYVFNPYADSSLFSTSANASGPIFDLPGGPVQLAIGGEYNDYKLRAYFRSGSLSATRTSEISPSRKQEAVYGQVIVPIVGASNAMPGIQKLNLSAAIRYDSYSDVGNTTNYQVGADWQPSEEVTFRANYGTSFRAPNLQDLVLLKSGSGVASVTLSDPLSPTGSSTGVYVNAGNPGLTPEKAKTFSVGTELHPHFVPNLSVHLSYFWIKYTNQVFSLSGNAYKQALTNPNYSYLVTRNPSPAQISALVALGLPLYSALPSNPAFLVDVRAYNLATTKTDGIDFSFDYAHDLWGGAMRASLVGVYTRSFDVQYTPTASTVSVVNTYQYPLYWQGRADLGWSGDNISADVFVNYKGAYRLIAPAQQINSLTTVDLSLGYTFVRPVKLLQNVQLRMDVTNLFDEKPPFVNIEGGFDPAQASPLGRYIGLTLQAKL